MNSRCCRFCYTWLSSVFLYMLLCIHVLPASPFWHKIDTAEISESQAVQTFEMLRQQRMLTCIHLPGSIVPANDDARCYHPLDFWIAETSENDTLSSDARQMIAAYIRFSELNPRKRMPIEINHALFKEIINKEEKIIAKGRIRKFFERMLVRIGEFIMDTIRLLLKPIINMPGWGKLTAVGLIVFAVFICLIIAAHLMSKAPLMRNALQNQALAQVSLYHSPRQWLDEASQALASGNVRKSLVDLYRWLVSWVEETGAVRRYEWWTNRQLLKAVRTRRQSAAALSESIIGAYEKVEYGHQNPDKSEIETLISSAGASRGRGEK